jgi:hypothetical protein
VAELIAGIGLHVVLGLVLCAAIWGLGLGWLLLARWRGSPVFAYPVGLLAVSLSAFAILLSPWLAPAVAAAALAAAAALVARRSRVAPLARSCVRPVAWALPFVAGLPLAMGLLLHGPTDEVPSSAFGDYVFWATRAVSAARSIVPFDDLLVADRGAVYVEGGSTFIGAALTHLPGIDVFLFQTATLPTLLLASVCLGLGMLSAEREGVEGASEEVRVGRAVITSLLGVAMIAYPTWLAESPPVSLAVPLTFSLFVLWLRPQPLAGLLGLSLVLAADAYLTKGFVGVALLILLGIALVRDHRATLARNATVPRVLVGLALAAGGIALILRLGLLRNPGAVLPAPELDFVPADAVRGLRAQLDARDTHALSPALAVAGQVLLAIALAWLRRWALGAVLVCGLALSWTVENYGFDLVIGVSALLALLTFWTWPASWERQRILVLAASLCLALSTWFRDTSGLRAGFVLVLLFGAAILTALLALEGVRRSTFAVALTGVGVGLLLGLAGRSLVAFLVLAILAVLAAGPAGRRLAPAAFGLSLACSLAVAAVAAARDDFRLSSQTVTLTTDHYDIWRRVEELVPTDSLVFTSMTGETIDGERGWNYYPGIAGRQLYIAGWYDGALLVEPAERARRLRLNRRILEGAARPTEEPLSREHGAYFAVTRRGEPAPSPFRRLYANERFELHRIPG